jgi:hypothetical protein
VRWIGRGPGVLSIDLDSRNGATGTYEFAVALLNPARDGTGEDFGVDVERCRRLPPVSVSRKFFRPRSTGVTCGTLRGLRRTCVNGSRGGMELGRLGS